MNTVSILIQHSSDLDKEIEELSQKVAKLKSKRPTKRRQRKINALENLICFKKQERNNTAFKVVYHGHIDNFILEKLL